MIDADVSWSLVNYWNRALETAPERPIVERNYVWASELGGSLIDRFYRMKGIAPTNPPNLRSLRKFEAGNLWEWMVGFVLKRTGLYLKSQEHLSFQYPDLLEVTGRLDYLAGGRPNWRSARAKIRQLELPDFLSRAATQIVDSLKEFCKQSKIKELKPIVLEVKSSALRPFEEMEENNAPHAHHQLQLFHYLKALNLDEGHIIYICKDDSRMLEFAVFNPSPIEELYRADIEAMTSLLKAGSPPERESEVCFNPLTCKFSKNWKIEYSPYLTMLYGYEQPMNFADKWQGKIAQFNRTIARMVECKKMTALNNNVIAEMKTYCPDLESYIATYKENHESAPVSA